MLTIIFSAVVIFPNLALVLVIALVVVVTFIAWIAWLEVVVFIITFFDNLALVTAERVHALFSGATGISCLALVNVDTLHAAFSTVQNFIPRITLTIVPIL